MNLDTGFLSMAKKSNMDSIAEFDSLVKLSFATSKFIALKLAYISNIIQMTSWTTVGPLHNGHYWDQSFGPL